MLLDVACIPCTKERHSTHERVPGWRERVEPFREKSLLWHRIWIDCGRPRNGVVADCMRRTRAKYHYAVREVKKRKSLLFVNALPRLLSMILVVAFGRK